jgi:hypothetical protein
MGSSPHILVKAHCGGQKMLSQILFLKNYVILNFHQADIIVVQLLNNAIVKRNAIFQLILND